MQRFCRLLTFLSLFVCLFIYFWRCLHFNCQQLFITGESKCRYLCCPRNSKRVNGALSEPSVNALGQRPYWPSRMERSYCTLGFHSAQSAHITVTAWRTARQPICVCDWSPRGKDNSHLTKLPDGLSYEKIRSCIYSPPYVTARWPPLQIPPLNFLGVVTDTMHMEK